MRPLAHLRRHVVGYLALFLVLGGVGHAAFVSSSGEIKACVISTTSGTQANTRIIDEAASCTSGQTPIAWNQDGQQGPAGEPGPTGPPGQSGEGGSEPSEDSSQSTVQPARPAGQLTQTGKVQRYRVKLKGTKARRFYVTGNSGPAAISPFGGFRQAWAKSASIGCPPALPVMLNYSVVGTAGTWDPEWSVDQGQFQIEGRQRAFFIVHAFPPAPTEEPPSGLEAYAFRIQGECVKT